MPVYTEAALITDPFAADVAAGLTKAPQKELPSKYLYDRIGSRLFDVITALPEYGLTRAEERILSRNAREMVARLPSSVIVAELGSGSGHKTRWILEALGRRRPTAYFPIEISRTALKMCEHELADIDSITVVGLEREYLDGLLEVAARRKPAQTLVVLFLGSTLGNLEGPATVAFLAELRRMLEPGDALVLGADLEKPLPRMLAAYDDALGVTAAFNLNLLVRINRELGGNFALPCFEHAPRFNAATRSIEMHLRSKCAQKVRVEKARIEVDFAEGETIWTESCHKFTLDEIARMARQSGFAFEAHWVDQEWLFAENLLIAE